MVNDKRKKLILNILIGIVFLFGVFKFYTTFSLEDGYKFESVVYGIEGEYIENISPYTDVHLFYQYFDLENCSIEVLDSYNHEITSGYVFNGSKTILYDDNHQVLHIYVNVIKGDYASDGVIDNRDFEKIGKCMIQECELNEYEKRSLDLDLDLDVHINDLVLLDKSVSLGYVDLSIKEDYLILQSEEQGRLLVDVTPSYGVNQNVIWSSSDDQIVTVDNAGRVTGHQEGEAKVIATTMDGTLSAQATIKVDNTIQLASYEGIGYVGGNDVVVDIKLIDYEGVTCSSSNEEVASCEISGKQLVMKAKQQGSAKIVVSSPLYGDATYRLDTYSVYLNVMPKYLCTTPNNIHYITVSGFHSGELSFEASDVNIIKNSYMDVMDGRKMLRIEMGSKQGRATLKVQEANGNASNEVTVDVYKLAIPQIGSVAKVGEEVTTTISGEHFGRLSCVSEDSSKALCRIEGNQLIVTPLALGNVTIRVYNQFDYQGSFYDCGEAQFLVVIQEES